MLSEYMFNKIQRYGTFPFLGNRRKGRVGVVELFVFLFEIDMVRDTGKTVVLGNLAQIILAMVLAYGLDVPMYKDFIIVSGNGRCLNQFIVGSAHP